MTELCYSYYDSPIGPLLTAGDNTHLHLISFPTGSTAISPKPEWRRDDASFKECHTQLADYFAGTRHAFDLPLKPSGTPFQQSVWAALQDIPFGETISYGTLAKTIGRPKASRAVGAANGANPIPIMIPCHRVIGADKSLTGFGGGLELKASLLQHEGIMATQFSLL